MNFLRQGYKLIKLPNIRRTHAGGGFIARNLFAVNILTSGGFMVIGDLVQQEIEYRTGILKKRYDWNRNLKMLAIGLVFGPIHHYYYVYLDRWITGTSMKAVMYKILLDQIVAAPLTYLAFFFTMGILENKSFEDSVDEFKKKILRLYIGDCFFWPPVQLINFWLLPTRFRVIYINIAQMVFNVYISYVKFCEQNIEWTKIK